MGDSIRWSRLLPALGITLALAACGGGGGGDSAGGDGGDGGTAGRVAVTLKEFSVSTVPGQASAGPVTFDITNEGPKDPHEFVVIKTDLGPTELPTKEDGSVDEAGEGMELIDEVEEIDVGVSASLEVDLEAGSYVLICNITEEEDGAIESHYQEGMRTTFTVA